MSRGYIAIAVGSRRSLILPNNLLTTMIIVMMMIVMMPSFTSAGIEMTSLSPADGFDIGGSTRMDITCQYDAQSVLVFKLQRNGTDVVRINYQIKEQVYKFSLKENNFDCTLPQATDKGQFKCWKNNLQCRDATSYTCAIEDRETSNEKFLKVKSSLQSLENINPPYELNKISTFRCVANVALPSHRTVTFEWRVTRSNNNPDLLDMINKQVTVPTVGQSSVRVQSDYEYSVTREDLYNTTISCSIFGQTKNEIIFISDRSL